MTFPGSRILALAIFVIASLTDALDGYVARHYQMITNFGKFIDPLADKLLVASALIAFVGLGYLPSWIVIVILAREFAISGLRTIAVEAGVVIAASIWGKLKTITQMVLIVLILLLPYLPVGFTKVASMLAYLVALVTVLSGADYIYKAKDLLKWQ